ncbi:MAG: hypothetical protein Q8O75_01145 [bacterium]|nr:hypothetical protein [bacterium]
MNNQLCDYCVNETKKASFSFENGQGQIKYICKPCFKSSFWGRWLKNNHIHLTALDSKDVRRYNLPLDHKYSLISIEYTGSLLDGGGSACENCGKLIVNIATVRTEENKIYHIGTDCAETLSFTDHNDFWKVREAQARHAKLMGYARKVKKAQAEGVKVTSEVQEGTTTILFNGVWQYRVKTDIFNRYFKI